MAMVREHRWAHQAIRPITRNSPKQRHHAETPQMLLWSARNQRLWPHCLWSRNPPRWQEDWSSNQRSQAKMRIRSTFVPQIDKLLFQIRTWLQQRQLPSTPIDQDYKFLSLGKRTRWKLHKTQASSSKSTGIGTLQPHRTFSACSRHIILGVRSSIATAASRFHTPTNCLWKSITNGSWNGIPSIREGTLAIVFGCEHFHQYLYGRHFELETDHRPLEHIFKPKISFQGKSTPARVKRWVLRLQEYDVKVVYRKENTTWLSHCHAYPPSYHGVTWKHVPIDTFAIWPSS